MTNLVCLGNLLRIDKETTAEVEDILGFGFFRYLGLISIIGSQSELKEANLAIFGHFRHFEMTIVEICMLIYIIFFGGVYSLCWGGYIPLKNLPLQYTS